MSLGMLKRSGVRIGVACIAIVLFVYGVCQWWLPSIINPPTEIRAHEQIEFLVKGYAPVAATFLTDGGLPVGVPLAIEKHGSKSTISMADENHILSPGTYVFEVKGGGRVLWHEFTWGMYQDGLDPLLFGQSATAVEVVDRRSEGAVTFSLGEGKFVAVSSGGKVFTPDGEGNLVPVTNYGRREQNAFIFDRLPDQGRIEFDLTHPQYTMRRGSEYITVRFAASALGVIENASTVAYHLSDYVTLRWRVVEGRVVKEIVVEREGDLPDLSFTVQHDDKLTLRREANVLRFVDSTGGVAFEMEQPFLMDAARKRLERPVTIVQRADSSYAFEFDQIGLSYPYIIDPTAGPFNPSADAEDQSVGTFSWSTRSNAYSSNDSYATLSLNGSPSYYGVWTGFGITSSNVPNTATIDGILFEVEANRSGPNAGTLVNVKAVKASSIVGDDKGSTVLTTTDTYYSYGSSSDLWGTTWTPSNVQNSGFGLALTGSQTAQGGARVDHIRVSVTYTEATVSVGGTVYSDEGTTTLGSVSVAISINGAAAAGTATANGSGVYSITGLTIAANDVLTLYIDGATQDAVTVTKGTGSNMTGIDLYQNDLITRCDNTCSLTNTNLDTADNNADADISAIYSVSAGALTVASGKSLYIPSSHTFAPGGNVSVGGNFSNNGTYTKDTETVTLTSTSASATLKTNSSSLYALTINGSGGTYTLQDALTTTNNLTITAGTLDTKSGSNFGVTVGNNYSNAGTFTARSGTVTFNATATGKTITSGGSSFYDLTFNGVGGGWTLQDATTVSNVLTITNGTLSLGSQTLTLSGTTGTPLSNSGTFTASTGTVSYTGNNAAGNTTVAAVTYYNLTLNNSSETYVLAAATTASNNLTITAGTLDAVSGSNYGLTVGGNWSNSGTFTARSGTVTLTSTSASATLTSGGSSFYALTQNGSGGTYTLQDALTTTNNLTITAGTLDTKSGSNFGVTVGGTWSRSGTFTPRSGTLTLTGTSTFSDTMSFYNLTINSSGITITLGAALTTTNNLTITAGTLDVSAAGCSSASCAVSVGGNWNNSGTFTARTGTVTLTSASASATLTSGGSNFYNLTQNGSGGTYTLQDALTTTNNLTITAGTLDTKSGSNFGVTVGGTWSNSGTFTARSGTVTLNGTNQTISGSTSFYKLTKSVTAAATLTLPANSTQTVSNALTLNGASGAVLSLRSSSSGTQWSIDPQGTRTVSYLNVQDSNNINASIVSCLTGCTDSGNNTKWVFDGTPVATTPYDISQSTDGTGYVTFKTKITDPDFNKTELAVEYSTNNETWKMANIKSTSSSLGSANNSQGGASPGQYQISSIDTDQGDVTLTVVWESKANLASIDSDTVYVRITPYDGTYIGTAKNSESFSIHNKAPDVKLLKTLSATSTTLKMGWTVNSIDSDFAEYVICVAVKRGDALKCNSKAVVWNKNDDAALTKGATASTTITKGLKKNTSYEAYLFATDTYSNKTTVPLFGAAKTNHLPDPTPTPPPLPSPTPTPTPSPSPTPTPLPPPTPVPTPTCGPNEVYENGVCVAVISVTPTPPPVLISPPPPPTMPTPPPTPIQEVLGTIVETVVTVVQQVIETVVEVVQQVVAVVQEVIIPAVVETVQQVVEVAQQVVEAVVEIVKEAIAELEPQRLAESAERVVEKAPKAIEDLRNAESVQEAREALAPIAEEPAVYVAATVAAPAAAVAVTSSGFSLTTTIAQTFQQMPAAAGRMWQGLLGLVGLRRRKHSWGRVVDLMNGKPLKGVVVEVYDHAAAKLKDTMITNAYGAFESLLPAGTYDLRVHKGGYAVTPEAPWLKLAGGEQVYDGRPITIAQERAVPFIVTMRPMAVAATSWRLVMRMWIRRVEIIVGYFSWPLLIIGFLLNSLTLFVKPTVVNVIVECVYILLMILKAWIAWRFNQFVSRVVDALSGAPIPQATVRLMDVMTDKVVTTKVTSGKGAVQLLPPPGIYTVDVTAPGYEPYRESHVIVRGERGGITLTMRLTPVGGASLPPRPGVPLQPDLPAEPERDDPGDSDHDLPTAPTDKSGAAEKNTAENTFLHGFKTSEITLPRGLR